MIVFAIALDLANLQQQSKINGFIRAVSLLSELNMMTEKEQESQNNTQIINRQHLLQFYHPCWLNAEQPVCQVDDLINVFLFIQKKHFKLQLSLKRWAYLWLSNENRY